MPASAEVKTVLLRGIMEGAQFERENERLELAARVEVNKTRRPFWFGGPVVALVSAALTLLLGEAFGLVRLNSEHSNQIEIEQLA